MIADKPLLLALPLKRGIIRASDGLLEKTSNVFEWISLFFGGGVFVGVCAEVWLAWARFPDTCPIGHWGPVFADGIVAAGVGGEIWFAFRASRCQGELTRRSKDRLVAAERQTANALGLASSASQDAANAQSEAAEASDNLAGALGKAATAEVRAAEAVERASKADLARTELETKLLPRTLNRVQWDFIQGLRGQFAEISIAYETDAETRWFANQIRDAFFSAGIRVGMIARAADVHSFGTLIYEPHGFEGANPRTVAPLVELFRLADVPGALAVITGMPSDLELAIANERPEIRPLSDVPMIIIGGRFVLMPPHIEAVAKVTKAAMDAAAKTRNAPLGESNI